MSDVVNYVNTPAEVKWTSAASDATASLTVTKPDGTALGSSPSVTDTAAVHTASITPTLPGRYLLHWSTAAESFVDILDVWTTTPRFLVSRERALERLRQSNNSSGTAFDAIMLYIAAASAVVEHHTGPLFIAESTWSEVSAHGQTAVVLPTHDVDVASVSIDGTVLDEAAYVVDESAGIVWVEVGARVKVSVTYTSGTSEVPVAAQMACLEIIAHSWQQTRQGVIPYQDDGAQTVTTSMGYAIPYRALEWLQAVPRAAGVA